MPPRVTTTAASRGSSPDVDRKGVMMSVLTLFVSLPALGSFYAIFETSRSRLHLHSNHMDGGVTCSGLMMLAAPAGRIPGDLCNSRRKATLPLCVVRPHPGVPHKPRPVHLPQVCHAKVCARSLRRCSARCAQLYILKVATCISPGALTGAASARSTSRSPLYRS
jgi:hypothetical protein